MANSLLPTEAEWLEALTAVDESLATLEEEFRPLARKTAALLQKKLARLDEILGQRDRVAEKLAALKELYPDLDTGDEVRDRQQAPSEATPSGEFRNMPVWQAAREVLRRAGRPMYTRAIADAVRAGGKKIDEPRSSKLNTSMRHKGHIFVSEKRDKKSVWSLVESSTERAGSDV